MHGKLIKVSHIAFIEHTMLMTGRLTPIQQCSQWTLHAHIAHGMKSSPILSQAPKVHQWPLLMLADKMKQLFWHTCNYEQRPVLQVFYVILSL